MDAEKIPPSREDMVEKIRDKGYQCEIKSGVIMLMAPRGKWDLIRRDIRNLFMDVGYMGTWGITDKSQKKSGQQPTA